MEPELPDWKHIDLSPHGILPIRDIGPADAPALVLLHGWTVTADLNWFACYEHLAQRYRVVAFDMRGHGRGIRSRRHFRFEDCAEDAIAVADAVGIDRFVAVGYSMGGAGAQVLARDHADRLDGVVLCATAGYFADTAAERMRMAVLPIVGLASRVAPHPVRYGIYGWMIDRYVRGRGLSDWATAEIAMCDPQALLDAGTALLVFDSRSWARDIDVPAAVVLTEADEVVPVERQRRLHESLPSSRLVTVRGKHGVCAYQPTRFLSSLESAVDSVRWAAGCTARAIARAAATTSAPYTEPGDELSRSIGPETLTAATTEPSPSSTAALTDATPASRSATLSNQPDPPRTSAAPPEPRSSGSVAPVRTIVRSPCGDSRDATQTRSSPSRT